MNAVEIEEAISELATQPFDAAEFPYAFLRAFDNKETTLKRLRSGASNKSDLGGVLQTSNIHIATCKPGEVTNTLALLKASPATARAKARFVLATDGDLFEAEDLTSDDAPVSCAYADFPNHFGFFLSLAGITTVKQVRESSFDIRATSRLNKLYVELLKDNPAWGTADRRPDMNHFMARLIFCFFAEDTDIFAGSGTFTAAIETMSAKDSSNTHDVISTLFRVMNTKAEDRASQSIPRWAEQFPYVNGGLFSGTTDVPWFSRIARSFLIHIGGLDWKKINPDIFGSMIQAVADEDERGALGMHYTSVPNILKVLNPLFLDDLRERLEEAGDNARMLLNLRKRMSKIRVFDPACGSGNFLVIAYKEMRAIEAEINRRRDEADRRTEIPLTNFRGIELRDFPAEIARLALIIAEYQCDVLYRGQKEALQDFLPLDAQNWITRGNALRLDWLSICPPAGTRVKHLADDLFHTPLNQAQINFENEGGETYICGNPPYKGTKNQTNDQKEDLKNVFSRYDGTYKVLDYVACWFVKSAEYLINTQGAAALVSTNSICQGNQVPVLWPLIKRLGQKIIFAHTSFKWANLAAQNAGVTVVVIGISSSKRASAKLFVEQGGAAIEREVHNINAYLVPFEDVIVTKASAPPAGRDKMVLGNQPYEGGYLVLEKPDLEDLSLDEKTKDVLVRKFLGSSEVINGTERYCLWIENNALPLAKSISSVWSRVESVKAWRLASTRPGTRSMADKPHQFCEMKRPKNTVIIVPIRSSEAREYLPAQIYNEKVTVNNLAYAIYDGSLINFSVISSKMHLVWISAICGKLETRFSYSNKMGWNTFPIPHLTQKNKNDLTRCAEEILLAREMYFPATIAELYEVRNGESKMPSELRNAHEQNDEVLERIYVGRRFRNDTERLENLFGLYIKATAKIGSRA